KAHAMTQGPLENLRFLRQIPAAPDVQGEKRLALRSHRMRHPRCMVNGLSWRPPNPIPVVALPLCRACQRKVRFLRGVTMQRVFDAGSQQQKARSDLGARYGAAEADQFPPGITLE